MPGFKPKFAVPLSQQPPTATLATSSQPTIPGSEVVGTSLAEGHSDPSVTPVKEFLDSSGEKTHQIDFDSEFGKDWKDTVASSKVAEKGASSLTDSQYEDIFSSVIQQATARMLLAGNRLESADDSIVTATISADRMENSSPTNMQNHNEVTPNTSPQDETPSKLLLQRPVKKKSHKKDQFHKRKTLDYVSSNSSGPKQESHNLKHKKEVKRRRRSDSDIILHRKKVLNKGVWVQCSEKQCLKWRYLCNCFDPSTLPTYWTCSMNMDDENQRSCLAPEVDWTAWKDASKEHFVYTDYNAGSIVWAKMAGYPSWPAMVDYDPDINLFYWYDEQGRVSHYHVVFLDDTVSRAWISSRAIEPYQDNASKISHYKSRDFKVELESAVLSAEDALKLSMEQRLEKYSFEKRYIASKKRSEWTPKRISKKEKSTKAERKAEKEADAQTVPTTSSAETAPTKCDAEVPQMKSATVVDPLEMSREKQEKRKSEETDEVSVRKVDENKEKKKKPSVGSQLAQVVQRAKAPLKLCFNKPPPQKCPKSNDSPPAVVPHNQQNGEMETTFAEVVADKMNLDPDIFTMEMDGSETESRAAEKKTKCVMDSPKTHVVKGEDEQLSLKDNTDEERFSPVLSNKEMFGKDFWDVPSDEKKNLGSQDPFSDLVMLEDVDGNPDDLQCWDEEKMKHLDELMPVITEHF